MLGDDNAKQEDPTADPMAWESITQKLLNTKKKLINMYF